MRKTNILIFPAGSESAINIFESLKYNLHFNVFGASGMSDHAIYIYPKDKLYIGDLFITREGFLDEFNGVLMQFGIEYVIPTHDTIALFLAKHQDKINAKVVCSPYETARIAENKKLTYEALHEWVFYPKVYNNVDAVTRFPVFLKPYVGAGGKGTHLAKNKSELENILAENLDLLICEYLPGREYTVDCFNNKNGELLFAGARIRERITIGITFHSTRVQNNRDFETIARELNAKFKIQGAWFFQVKEDEFGHLKFMEFSVRQGGTMAFYRQLGVNFAVLSVFDAMGYDVKVLFNDYQLSLDRCLKTSYRFGFQYETLYIDFDDTLVVEEKVNTTLMKLIYQSVNLNKKIILLTKHAYDLDESLKRYRISRALFDDIILIEPGMKKADYIKKSKAVFIDNYFPERVSVKEICNIPVFDVDAVECLIDSSAI